MVPVHASLSAVADLENTLVRRTGDPTLGTTWSGVTFEPFDCDGFKLLDGVSATEYTVVLDRGEQATTCSILWSKTAERYVAECEIPNTGEAGLWSVNASFHNELVMRQTVQAKCPEATFEDADDKCRSCHDEIVGIGCEEAGTTLSKLHIKPGFWRASDASTRVRQCLFDGACVGWTGSASGINQNTTDTTDVPTLSPTIETPSPTETFPTPAPTPGTPDPQAAPTPMPTPSPSVGIANGELSSGPNSTNYCAVGFHGPICALCDPGFVPAVDRSCRKCSGNELATRVVIISVSVIIVLSVLLAITKYRDYIMQLLLKNMRERHIQSLRCKAKILFVHAQINCELPAVFTSVRFPPVFEEYSSSMSAMKLQFTTLLSYGCVVQPSYELGLLAVTLTPVVFGFITVLVYRRTVWLEKERRREERNEPTGSGLNMSTGSGRNMPAGSEQAGSFTPAAAAATATADDELGRNSSAPRRRSFVTDNIADARKSLQRKIKANRFLTKYDIKQKIFPLFLLFTYCVFPSVSTSIFATFACGEMDGVHQSSPPHLTLPAPTIPFHRS